MREPVRWLSLLVILIATVGGTMTLPSELRAQQVPPHWSIHFHVDDVGAALARATARGCRWSRSTF